MGEVEEIQEKMKADMEAIKEKMVTMMEAMMSVKKIMEANAVAIAATSVVAKVNLMSPSGINQMNHPTSDMVGKDLGSTGSPHDVQIQIERAVRPDGLPLIRMSITPLLYPLRASNPKLIMHMSLKPWKRHMKFPTTI